ncbi:MAG: hypothetical protein IJ444_02115 [Kiritimatiellae bacterium]|nr:hypothetical protein [Kiritimatiellia bacterium]
MLNYLEYLNVPSKVTIALVVIFLGIQIVGEILEFKGKAVPEFVKIRKYFQRKKTERETLRMLPETLQNVQTLLNNVNQHYSDDNIALRDQWMKDVNKKLEEHDNWRIDFDKKLDANTEITRGIQIDNKRTAIIDFAARVVDENVPVTHEQFNRAFKLYDEYEEIIKEHNMTNGEIDVAHRIIKESYESHLRNRTFIEDVRGY